MEGGKKGVGRVTKPKLGLQIGKAAINPTALKTLEQAVRQVASYQLQNEGVDVVISATKGEAIAKNTKPLILRTFSFTLKLE
jgi:cobalt-precorrin-5B (C1)-methyltransferase